MSKESQLEQLDAKWRQQEISEITISIDKVSGIESEDTLRIYKVIRQIHKARNRQTISEDDTRYLLRSVAEKIQAITEST